MCFVAATAAAALDGDKFELDEPPPGVVWTRADYQLPSEVRGCALAWLMVT